MTVQPEPSVPLEPACRRCAHPETSHLGTYGRATRPCYANGCQCGDLVAAESPVPSVPLLDAAPTYREEPHRDVFGDLDGTTEHVPVWRQPPVTKREELLRALPQNKHSRDLVTAVIAEAAGASPSAPRDEGDHEIEGFRWHEVECCVVCDEPVVHVRGRWMHAEMTPLPSSGAPRDAARLRQVAQAIVDADDEDRIAEIKVDVVTTPGYPRSSLRQAARAALADPVDAEEEAR